MPNQDFERKLVVILSADVAGYSRLMGENESGTLARLNAIRSDLFDPKTEQYGGRIVKLVGDGILVEFHSIVEAVNFALDVQKEMSVTNSDVEKSNKFEFRIGINASDVIVQDDDIYGHGVNIAARIEGVAPVGGIALSEAVFQNIEGKIVGVFEKLGPISLKNIETPVVIYSWPIDAQKKPENSIQAVNGLPVARRPSIIVMPFLDSSNETGSHHFADGISEDIIYELSRFSGLAVISRNSAFSYKDREVSAKELRRELGVRYVLEGSIRRRGERVRVSVELINAQTDTNVWATRYDKDLTDVYDVEDEIVLSVVGALPGRILQAEKQRVKRKSPNDMAAYDHLVAGRILHHRVSKKDNDAALHSLDKAIKIDPEYSEAYAWKACTLGQSVAFGFCDDPAHTETQAFENLETALSLNESDTECHRLLCEVCIETSKIDQATVHNDRVLSMNPNDPRLLAQRGEVLTLKGQADEGIEWLEKAMKLDPYGAPKRAHLLGRAFFGAKRYREAAITYDMILQPSPAILAECAASYAEDGDLDKAKIRASSVLQDAPDFSVTHYTGSRPFTNSSDIEHLAEGMLLAGLPQ